MVGRQHPLGREISARSQQTVWIIQRAGMGWKGEGAIEPGDHEETPVLLRLAALVADAIEIELVFLDFETVLLCNGILPAF